MNWTLSRTHAALTTLDQRLRDVGQALRIDTGHRYAITTDPHALELSARQHAREQHDTGRLDLTTARILETALNGRRRERAWSEFTTPEQRATLQRLLDLDLITEDGFLITATPELRVDLGYDGAPPGHMRGW